MHLVGFIISIQEEINNTHWGVANGEYVKIWEVGCEIRTSGMGRCVAG